MTTGAAVWVIQLLLVLEGYLRVHLEFGARTIA